MIIDTHFHAFPGKFLDLIPEAQKDTRGTGFHAFNHREYLDVMDAHGIDMGVLSNTGGRIEKGGDRAKALELCRVLNDSFAEAHAKFPARFKAFRIVYSGLFDRYPGIKLIASHLGGMILLYLDRLNWREGDVKCKEEPEHYFKRVYYDTAGPIRAPFIKLVYDTVGPDHILFGADFPHGRGGRDDQFYPMTLKAMAELDVPKEDKEKIYYKNAQTLGF